MGRSTNAYVYPNGALNSNNILGINLTEQATLKEKIG
jgi:hypothetical protein